jgi:tungstate transport system substrate-binding protein
MFRRFAAVVSMILAGAVFVGNGICEDKMISMSTTTSTESSGLLEVLLPALEKDTGIKVKVVAKGTGAAIRDGEDGNVDVILVHAKGREMKFVADGFGTERYPVMHNDFVLIGPAADPAKVKGSATSMEALKKIADAGAMFISRGDDSGTHTKEQEVWMASGVSMAEKSITVVKDGKESKLSFKAPANSDAWYTSIGQGMGKTITFAEEKQAYTLTDRGTYIAYKYGKTPAVELEILFEGDEGLANPYGVIPVNPKKHPGVKYDLAMEFVNWLTGPKGQKAIGDFKMEGKQLFFPDVIK